MSTHRSPLVTAALVTAAVAAGLAACGSPTVPVTTQTQTGSTYVLKTVNGQAAPAVLNASQVDTTFILADTVRLDGRGGATDVRQTRHVLVAGGTPQDARTVTLYGYKIAADSIVLSISCAASSVGAVSSATTVCGHGAVGAFSATAMTLTDDISPRTGPVLGYARLASELTAFRGAP